MRIAVTVFLVSFLSLCCSQKKDNPQGQTNKDTNKSISEQLTQKDKYFASSKVNTKIITDSIDSKSAKLFSGVYRGLIHTYATCVSDTATAIIYFDLERTPVTIVYDGTVLENANVRSNVIYVEGSELGRFVNNNKKIKFVYNGSMRQLQEPENNDKIDWTKIEFTASLRNKYDDYLTEYKNYLIFWNIFEQAFTKDDYEKISSYAKYPITGGSRDIKSFNELKTFLQQLKNEYIERVNRDPELYRELSKPTRFTDSDSCFPKEYIWIAFSSYLVFQYKNGFFEITSIRSFN
jgi:hypothetical protein